MAGKEEKRKLLSNFQPTANKILNSQLFDRPKEPGRLGPERLAFLIKRDAQSGSEDKPPPDRLTDDAIKPYEVYPENDIRIQPRHVWSSMKEGGEGERQEDDHRIVSSHAPSEKLKEDKSNKSYVSPLLDAKENFPQEAEAVISSTSPQTITAHDISAIHFEELSETQTLNPHSLPTQPTRHSTVAGTERDQHNILSAFDRLPQIPPEVSAFDYAIGLRSEKDKLEAARALSSFTDESSESGTSSPIPASLNIGDISNGSGNRREIPRLSYIRQVRYRNLTTALLRCRILIRLDQYTKALVVIEKALDLAKDLKETVMQQRCLYWCGRAQAGQELWKEALDSFREASMRGNGDVSLRHFDESDLRERIAECERKVRDIEGSNNHRQDEADQVVVQPEDTKIHENRTAVASVYAKRAPMDDETIQGLMREIVETCQKLRFVLERPQPVAPG